MNRRLNHITAAALSLMLVLTGEAMAQLRAAPGPAGVMEICTGTGPVRVTMGEDGAPLDASHVCPDCVMATMTDILPQDALPVHLPRVSRLEPCRSLIHAALRGKVRALARSPPDRA